MSKPTRGSEMPQWRSVRGLQPKTSSSDSDPPVRHRRVTKPKLDQKSPRSVHSDPTNKKRLGTRIADVETQLGLAQEELKILKEQLASAEAAKVQAQEQLEKKCENPTTAPDEIPDNHPSSEEIQDTKKEREPQKKLETPANDDDDDDNNQPETDVFEVPMQKAKVEEKEEEDHETKPTFDDMALKDEEILLLKTKLEEKANELETIIEENQTLKHQLGEAALKISESQAKEERMTSELNKVEKKLKDSKSCEEQLQEKLGMVEKEKQEVEDEMKKMKIQTEQWRKAADAAAAVLSGDAETNGGRRRISERCGSMDKHVVGSFFEPGIGRYRGFVDSPGGFGDDSDEENGGGGKRRGHGMKMFGDLWKKKGHK